MIRLVLFLVILLPFSCNVCAASIDLLSQGVAQYKDESFEEAASTLEKAYKEQPDNVRVVFYLGMSYMQMLEFDKALGYLQKAAAMQPDDGRLAVYLGEALYNLHDYPTAETTLQHAINNGIESARAYYFLGLTRYAAGKFRLSLDSFAQAGRLDGRMQIKVLYLSGMAHRGLGEEDAAALEFKQVVQLAPGSDEAVQADAMLSQPVEKNFRLSINLSEQFDSNVVLEPASSSAGVTVTRARDYVSNASLGAQFTHNLDGRLGLTAGYAYSQSLHSKLSFYDVQAHHIDVTPNLRMGKDQAMMILSLDGVGVDYRRYMAGFGVMPGYVHDYGNNRQGTLLLGFQRKVFFWADTGGSDNRDANNYQIGYTYTWSAPQSGKMPGGILQQEGSILSASYVYDIERAGGINWSYTGHHLTLSGAYPIMDTLQLSTVADQYRQNYHNINTFYNVKRRDTVSTLSPALEWDPLDRVTFKAAYSFTRALSNIPVYDYRRSLVTLSAEGRF